ncbi:MAG: Galactose-1-phosphate uridylyltransferase [Candidatus Berkelbacteria bacterium Licking1014_7]|uniref:Galactose-1-phosphate uridylyltransferase n=1 Tax=Candidatus Berkelbacteria bacterium Licking1014_7 TaxID=2017147 RepID=A0A554LIJ7_9BACT|nr:MAG: Galactose-1-phosphate uridylyltransferase [Candidatus Berkelbacteria bacterium Licking1014_7]
MPQLRQNIITGEWVVMAPERAKRPNEYVTPDTIKKQSKKDCPFCVGKATYKTQIKDAETENIYVAPNKFPAFVKEEKISSRSYYPEDGFYRAKPAVGGHEIIIVKDHNLGLNKMPENILAEMLEATQKRYQYYHFDGLTEYIMGIYNHGAESGASIEHPHAQLFASSIVPNHIIREKHGAEKYFEINGVCVFCDLVEHEKQEKIRILYENEYFVGFTFYASRFPFEIWVLPKIHQSNFEDINKREIDALANALRLCLNMLDATLNDPPLNYFIHSLPTTSDNADYFHWHLEIAPRLTGFGGYEMGAGTIIDIATPESCADYLRQGLKNQEKFHKF